METWSKQDVVWTLLRAAENTRSRAEIARYFASRSRRLASLGAKFAKADHAVELKGLAGPLHCSAQSGGLAIYYEIVTQSVYAPDDDWVPERGDLVIDVGANIGVFSLWAAATVQGEASRVVAIEPNPVAFDMLVRNTEDLSSVTTLMLACGGEATTGTLHFPPGRPSVGSFDTRPDRTESVDVSIRPLDEALAEHVGPISLLKIDVEGAEFDVLRGATATLARTSKVVLEIAGTDLAPCEKLLVAAGLTRTGLLSGMWNIPDRHGVIAYFKRDA